MMQSIDSLLNSPRLQKRSLLDVSPVSERTITSDLQIILKKIFHSLEASRKVSVFIGEENIIPELETSAMIIKRINLEGEEAYIGML
jgi:hypothetical protein